MMIETGKKYQTRDGRPVRILCVDMAGDFPVVGIVEYPNSEYVHVWQRSGARLRGVEDESDLIEVVEPRTVWINVYEGNGFVSFFGSRKIADGFADHDKRSACIEITYRPGDGLEDGK